MCAEFIAETRTERKRRHSFTSADSGFSFVVSSLACTSGASRMDGVTKGETVNGTRSETSPPINMRWLTIVLAVFCGFFSFQQLRMYGIYRGSVYSSAIGSIEPNPVLSAIALRSAITFAIFAFLVLLVPWPRVLTYVTGLWVCRAIIDTILCSLGRGQYRIVASMLTDRGRKASVLNASSKAVGNALWFGTCIYFFGF
jgi:hypothetical protein